MKKQTKLLIIALLALLLIGAILFFVIYYQTNHFSVQVEPDVISVSDEAIYVTFKNQNFYDIVIGNPIFYKRNDETGKWEILTEHILETAFVIPKMSTSTFDIPLSALGEDLSAGQYRCEIVFSDGKGKIQSLYADFVIQSY